jgi:hypothetical protein
VVQSPFITERRYSGCFDGRGFPLMKLGGMNIILRSDPAGGEFFLE